MFPSLNSKLIIAGISIVVAVSAVYATYRVGYTQAEQHYKQLLYEFSLKAEKLRTIEERVTREIVTEYKDRIRVVTEKETILLSTTDDLLKIESSECKIGPNFIKLHNEAATK